ncbi:hypothetical protein MPLDJ20_120064 [Mesorhizobium plurifarium]|uniref:Uncharacterized protein n=1 Tax=Mesorhizobium plurifarium TaxID=69974 RepID=A0A090EAP3_MESPL|nr:hypothetical protein MPLDJ20_120064 [Mesorhizobium plurifarium]
MNSLEVSRHPGKPLWFSVASADRHFTRDARKIRRFDADIGAVGIAHRVQKRERRTVTLVFLRPRPSEHFSEEPHDSIAPVGPPDITI